VLKYLEPTGDVQDGDMVVTSGNSFIYPKGLAVGHVAEVKSEPGNLFKFARVIPETKFERLEEVAIIVGESTTAQGKGAPEK
jgi:rod shape-determining protein MreC